MDKALRNKLSRIKLIICDVDGVLTDGTIIKGADGVEFKRFSINDGAGVALARAVGLRIALISGRHSEATESRARELQIEDVYNGTLNKLIPYEELKRKYHLEDAEIAYLGDDLIDIPVMEKAGVAIAVKNAYPPVKDVAIYTTETRGGEGALREAVDWIIQAQGRYTEALAILKEHLEKIRI
jgi:3-deoxy-D-manno-octulosonate 8-phosphate phosphatase (KDO 8-P phosphatase)